MMKRILAVVCVIFAASVVVFAQNGTPSAKAGATLRTLSCVYGTQAFDEWVNIGDPIIIKTNNVNELLIGVSLETGLYTQTKVGTKVDASGLLTSEAMARAGVQVRVVLDNDLVVPVAPGVVTFDQRIQTLSAKLGQALTGCTINVDTGLVQCTGLADQEVQLILDTLGAHAFNFVKGNVGVGVHSLQVQFKLDKDTVDDGTSSTAVAKACAGLGSVTVESVRMANYIELP